MTSAPTPSFALRPARPEDDAFLYELYCSTRQEEVAAWGWGPAQRDAFLRMQFMAQQHQHRALPNAEHRLILRGDRPAGRILVTRGEEELRLVDVALLPEQRSGGIGTALIQALQEEAAKAGKPLRLQVLKTHRAAALYRRLGFEPLGDSGVYLAMEWRAGAGPR